jgi:hypothetical protein
MANPKHRISFFITCENGRAPGQDFEADRLRTLLRDGSLQFSCIICGASWPASTAKMENARQLLEREAS